VSEAAPGMSPDNGPGPPGPEVGEGRATPSPADVEKVLTEPPITNTTSITQPRHGDGLAAMRRRRRDSRRLPPIGACGCIRDPSHDRHRCGAQISDKQLQAAVDAAHHIIDAGYLPIFDVPTLRALWKSGHHELVDELHGAKVVAS
jgi:hypothetical protein